jgi:signal transduction histidine kinase
MKLKNKLIFTILSGFLASFSIVIWLEYSQTKNVIVNVVQTQQLELAHQTMDKIDRLLYERFNTIQSLTSDLIIQSYLRNNSVSQTAVLHRLNDLTVYTGPWDELMIVNKNGKILASSNENNIGRDIRSLPGNNIAFQSALSYGQIYYSDIVPADTTNKPTMIYATPIRDEQDPGRAISGVIIGNLSWQAPLEILQSTKASLMDIYNSKGLEIGNNRFNEFGNILKEDHRDNPVVKAALSGKEDSVITKSIDNNYEALTSYVTEKGYLNYKGNNWVMIIETPSDTALKSAFSTALMTALSFLPVVIILLLVTLYLISRMLKPIQDLTQTIIEITNGDLSRQVQVTSKDEIGVLGNAFNTMASKLRTSHDNLENNIREKTAELEKEKAGIEQKVIERTQQLTYEQARLQASINSLPLGFMMTNTDNKLAVINNTAKDILTLKTNTAYPAEKANDVSWVQDKINMEYVENCFKDHVDLNAQIALASKKTANIILKDVPYKMLFLNIYISPIISKSSEEVIGTVILLEDTTEQKLLERSRDEFFSIASHELRTPLTAIRGNSSLIQDYYLNEIPNPTVRETLADIHESSIRLIKIVNDFLDVSRLELGQMQFTCEVFDPVKLAQDVIREYDVTGSQKKLYLKITPPGGPLPQVYADKNKVRQVLINLLGNGIKFTKAGGVEFTFREEGNYVKIFVADTGMGIPDANKKLLFRKFQQAESNILTRDASRGTGLGLYISRFLMTNMGGNVVLESTAEGKGSIFSVTIPIATKNQLIKIETEKHV